MTREDVCEQFSNELNYIFIFLFVLHLLNLLQTLQITFWINQDTQHKDQPQNELNSSKYFIISILIETKRNVINFKFQKSI